MTILFYPDHSGDGLVAKKRIPTCEKHKQVILKQIKDLYKRGLPESCDNNGRGGGREEAVLGTPSGSESSIWIWI